MELYHNNMSVCAQKVRVVLAEKGLKPIEHHLNLRAGEHTHEYLQLNPKGVVPTLIDKGEPIIESTIISDISTICSRNQLCGQRIRSTRQDAEMDDGSGYRLASGLQHGHFRHRVPASGAVEAVGGAWPARAGGAPGA